MFCNHIQVLEYQINIANLKVQAGRLICMCFLFSTSSSLCSGCQNFMGKGLNNGPQNFVPGNCAKRLIQYHQLHLSANVKLLFFELVFISIGHIYSLYSWFYLLQASIASQREVVSDFFAPSAKRRWCFSQCKNRPKQAALFAPVGAIKFYLYID